MSTGTSRRYGISRTVVVLGVVSLLTDISSEGIYPLIPLFLVNVLHAQAVSVGLIEGIAESTASIVRIFSGWLSDVIGGRKWITTAGYALSTVSKPLLSVTTSWHQVFAIRFADRLGKGIRSAPRDALIADVTAPESRGISFGFHRAMDTVGAVTGPLIAFWLLRSMGMDYRRLFLLSAIPAALAVVIIIFFVRESTRAGKPTNPPSLSLRGFGVPFKKFLFVATLFSIGNSSDVFLILRAQNLGISVGRILLIYVLFNSVEATLATAAGAVSDRLGRRNVILAGYLVFALVYAGFGFARHPAEIWVLFAFYGLYNSLTSGVQKAFAADLVPAGMRGTGLGAYHMLTGIALLPASVIAGYLWDKVNPSAPFYYGAAVALVAALMLAVLFRGSVTYTDT
ncbi:MAG: MFS transporter [Armatimonadetes bacterium]|nr:MFS transporter [Armatimonadota bacterium]